MVPPLLLLVVVPPLPLLAVLPLPLLVVLPLPRRCIVRCFVTHAKAAFAAPQLLPAGLGANAALSAPRLWLAVAATRKLHCWTQHQRHATLDWPATNEAVGCGHGIWRATRKLH